MNKDKTVKLIKRAAIYIRVSSERQAEKASPQEQEKDCKAYCESHRYQIVAIYRDIERYRVGKRLVEPSGERADRPQLRKLLNDADRKMFDVIVAWREDRLYRGMRPMPDVIECIEKNKVEVELVKEVFDSRMAPVKAWAARMELEAKNDRLLMGMANRFEKGMTWSNPAPYGYKRVEGKIQVNEEEARWVRLVFEWYASGVNMFEIRRRLINSGVKQRHENVKRPWHLSNLRRLLKKMYYYTGKQAVKWNDQYFEIDIPPIIDPAIAEKVLKRKASFKVYRAGNMKHDYLAAGMLYCAACKTRMKAISTNNGYRRKDGTKKIYYLYGCGTYENQSHDEGCAKKVLARKIDDQLWTKVWALISDPDEFERAINAKISELKAKETVTNDDLDRIRSRLGELSVERQKVITWARKGQISDDDLEVQLSTLALEQVSLEQELEEKKVLVGNSSERLKELARLYREQINNGMELINGVPEDDEQRDLQFQFRRRIIQQIVKRVEVNEDKTIKVYLQIDLQDPPSTPTQPETSPSGDEGTVDIFTPSA